jgi:hypothetical protein
MARNETDRSTDRRERCERFSESRLVMAVITHEVKAHWTGGFGSGQIQSVLALRSLKNSILQTYSDLRRHPSIAFSPQTNMGWRQLSKLPRLWFQKKKGKTCTYTFTLTWWNTHWSQVCFVVALLGRSLLSISHFFQTSWVLCHAVQHNTRHFVDHVFFRH